jgi:hypothetical protein
MKKILKSESGSVLSMVVAVLVSLISVISSASLISLVGSDQLNTQFAHDKLQEELLLRSEAIRTHLAIEHNVNSLLPSRTVEIIEPNRVTTYFLESKKEQVFISVFMGFATEQAVAIQTLITAKRAKRTLRSFYSPVQRYSERLVRNKSLAEFQYFTHTEESENADGGAAAAMVKFWGPDVLYGPVHSNDDIWVQQAGGGINQGWPTFYAMVTTAGIFRNYDQGGAQLSDQLKEQIFLGGWAEGSDGTNPIVFEPNADLIELYGIPLGDPSTDIVYVKLQGGSFISMYGNIVETGVEAFDVYSWYPHNPATVNAIISAGGNWYEDSDHIWTNSVTIYDTIWTTGSSFSLNNQSVWVGDAQLWIEGVVAGKQTFGCADTIFIVGDITYASTTPGDPPDDPEDPNLTDYFGLVSEKKILIRYKHRDPFNNMELRDDNCIDIRLYGAYAAIGEGDSSQQGDMYCHDDGIFTFQYHHPHGSTPDFEAPSPYISDEYSITLFDSGGNGWNGASLDVIVDEVIVLDDITCYSSQSSYTFTVENGDIIETSYTQGGNGEEHTYEIYNQNGDLVASDGPNPGPGIVYQVFLPPSDEDTLYTYIDLHKFIFPITLNIPPNIEGFKLHGNVPIVNQTCGFPYESLGYLNSYPNNNSSNYAVPYGTDYPWYNPVWPESSDDIVSIFASGPFERGTITIFGAIAQRRRGFVHRSGTDPYNHPGDNQWEMDVYHYDGTHGSSGYGKDYHYDQRFLYVQPPDYPQIYEGFGEATLTAFKKESWSFKSPPKSF